MKRLLVALMVLIMAFSMFGFAPAASVPAPAKADKELEIVMVAKMEGVSWFDDMRVGVEAFGEDYKVNAYQIAPDTGDPAKQAQMVEDLIAKGVDAILVVPNDPKSMEPVLKKAKEKGIVVVTHEAQALAPIVDYDMEAFKNEDFGVVMGKSLAEAMGGEGKYTGFVGALTMETHMQWFNAMQDYLKKNNPKMEFVSKQPYEDNNDEKAAYAKVQEILKTYPDLKGMFGNSASSTTMEGLVLKEKNNKNIKVVGLSLPSMAGEYIKDGFIQQAQCWRPADAGYVTALIAYNILKGTKIEDGMNLVKPGYEKVKLENKIIYGNAPLILKKDTVDKYDF
jgi:simple sugar transport system substrate-binding protein